MKLQKNKTDVHVLLSEKRYEPLKTLQNLNTAFVRATS